MTVQAMWLQNVDYPARWDRTVYDQLWTQGTLTSASFAVTQLPSPAMAVNVAPGTATVTGTDQSYQGKYLCRDEDGAVGLAITAAPGSGTRHDLVVLTVRDPNAGGAAGDDAIVQVITGVASGTPVDPTVPPSSLVLARVRVASGTGVVTNAMIDDLRVRARLLNGEPSGSVSMFAGSTVPDGYLLCNGQAVSQTTYASLFALLGSTYNTSGGQLAPGAGLFRVPLMTGRVPVGLDAGQAEFDVLGETGGDKSVTLTAAQSGLPAHSHANTASASTTVGILDPTHDHTSTIGTTEGAHQHRMTANQTPSGTHGHTTNGTLASGLSGTGGSTSAFTNTLEAGYEGKHGHTVTTAAKETGITAVAATSVTMTNVNNAAANASAAHTNLQPYSVINFIIKF